MGKTIFIFIISMLAVNGFWYCATMQETMGQTPVIVIPVISSIVLGIYLAAFIANTWYD